MPDLTPHFTLAEFACKCLCGGESKPEILANLTRVAKMLEAVRVALGGVPITITSGYRCPKHNAHVGGAPQSQHLTGRAADIQVKGMEPLEVQRIVKGVSAVHGVGEHPRFTHLDIRGHRIVFRY